MLWSVLVVDWRPQFFPRWAFPRWSPPDRAAGFFQNEQSKRPAWKLQMSFTTCSVKSHTVTSSICVGHASYPYSVCEGATQEKQVRIMVEGRIGGWLLPPRSEYNHEILWYHYGDKKLPRCWNWYAVNVVSL